ncbi:MAG: transposase [Planctomycetota bacterium]
MVGYLARYAKRVVIANDRLIKIEDGEVYFSYKDYRGDNRWETSGGTG